MADTAHDILAEVEERILTNRRDTEAARIAVSIYLRDGSVNGEQVAAQLDASFFPPENLHDLIASKLQGAVAYHEREAEVARLAVEHAQAKVDRIEQERELALEGLTAAQAAASAAEADTSVADIAYALDVALAVGANPGSPEDRLSVEARAEVATAVAEGLGKGA